jgi:bifunctional DNA-binding transcriptional regulator/antitoxin component of YhaV-PrlF toxin-antitoxin module
MYIGSMSGPRMMELLGESKFDKLRRISLIKSVSDRLGMKEGDLVEFYLNENFEIVIMKKPEAKKQLIEEPVSTEDAALLFDALQKVSSHFIESSEGKADVETVIREVADSFPENKRAYLLNKLSEMAKNMGLLILGIEKEKEKRIRN